LYRFDALAEAVGHPITLAQVNTSRSRRGSIRGIHYADVPPGQAKYVTCARGSILDVVVDIRTGSPSFGSWCATVLDESGRASLYIPEGLGHGFIALTEDAVVNYLCSATYNPAAERGINPLDPELGIGWPPEIEPVLSPKDLQAPSLAEAGAQGVLPRYADCLAFYETLSSASSGSSASSASSASSVAKVLR
jgi:dTDP-4-dehydrorhamnose 3,5-epimerase